MGKLLDLVARGIAVFRLIDGVWLDGVMQPVANRLHQWFGIRPIPTAIFFAMGHVVGTAINVIFLNATPGGLPIELGFMTVALSMLLALLVVFPRTSYTFGVNPKREWLLPFRCMYSLFALWATGQGLAAIPELLFLVPMTGLIAFGAYWFATQSLWLGFCFASLNRPPPRVRRAPKEQPAKRFGPRWIEP